SLLLACDHGCSGAAAELCRWGANVNAVNDRGETPLMLAVENGDAATVSLLLTRGAKAGSKDRTGRTALDRCIRPIVGTLLEKASGNPMTPETEYAPSHAAGKA